MVGFWKFNVFVGTVGVLLLAAGCYGGLAKPEFMLTKDVMNAMVHFNFNPENVGKESVIPGYLFLSGLAALGYQVLMTSLGLLAGFFGAPAPTRR